MVYTHDSASLAPTRSPRTPARTASALSLGVCLRFDAIRESAGTWLGSAPGAAVWESLGSTAEYVSISLRSLDGRLANRKHNESPSVMPFDGDLKLHNFFAFETPSFVDPDQLLLPRAYLASGVTGVLDCVDAQGRSSAWAFRFALNEHGLRIEIG